MDGLRRNLARLARYRGLLWILSSSELKARHRQTVLGLLWAVAQPLSMMLVFTVVFSVFVRVPVEGAPYALFAFTGLWAWQFFSSALSQGLTSVVASINLITKASFPREVLPLSKVLIVGVDFLIGGVVLACLMVFFGLPFRASLLAVPAIVGIHLIFTVGLALLCSALYVLKRDVGSLLPLGLQIWMFLSPVVYPVSLIPEAYRSLYMLNPMAMIVEAYRGAILFGTVPPAGLLAPALVVALGTLAVGYAYFKAVELRFADVM